VYHTRVDAAKQAMKNATKEQRIAMEQKLMLEVGIKAEAEAEARWWIEVQGAVGWIHIY